MLHLRNRVTYILSSDRAGQRRAVNISNRKKMEQDLEALSVVYGFEPQIVKSTGAYKGQQEDCFLFTVPAEIAESRAFVDTFRQVVFGRYQQESYMEQDRYGQYFLHSYVRPLFGPVQFEKKQGRNPYLINQTQFAEQQPESYTYLPFPDKFLVVSF